MTPVSHQNVIRSTDVLQSGLGTFTLVVQNAILRDNGVIRKQAGVDGESGRMINIRPTRKVIERVVDQHVVL